MFMALLLPILFIGGIFAAEDMSTLGLADNLNSPLPIHSTNLTNSTIHIGSVIIHDTATSNVSNRDAAPVIHRYMITLTEPQVWVCFVIVGVGVLIFLFIIINLMVFSYSHQQSQKELLSQLSDIATELEGITSKSRIQCSVLPLPPVRRRRPASFAALPTFTTTVSKANGGNSQRYSCNQLTNSVSKGMAPILEV